MLVGDTPLRDREGAWRGDDRVVADARPVAEDVGDARPFDPRIRCVRPASQRAVGDIDRASEDVARAERRTLIGRGSIDPEIGRASCRERVSSPV